MSHVNDSKLSALQTLLSVSGGQVDDLENDWLVTQVAAPLHVNDMWMEVFDTNNTGTSLTGTVTVTAGTAAVVGVGTLFTTELGLGDKIKIGTEVHAVLAITDNLNMTLSKNHVAGAAGAAFSLLLAQWNDAAAEFLGDLGHSGALPDMWKTYWDAGGGTV